MELQPTDVVWPWILATLLFLILLGTGRTLRGAWLGHPPFGAGVALSVALGVFFHSMIWLGLGQLGFLRAPFPWLLFALGFLIALPGLLWTVRDHGRLAPGLERGFGPRWFATGAWLFLVAALLISFFWISGVTGYGGIGFLFERAGLDYAVGHTFYDEGFPRSPFLGDEPLGLWVFGLGAPIASLALAWWLGVAILFGVCGLGWRLHHHGAGLAAAATLAIVLFATDQPLFLAPALPAALAIIAVIVLAVESRGRPHLGRTLVAGGLGGFALISDLGTLAMLVPLLLFGPSWCKLATGLGLEQAGRGARDGEAGAGEVDRVVDDLQPAGGQGAGDASDPPLDDALDDKLAWDDKGFEEGVKIGGLKKWLTPLRHTGYGLVGLSLPLVPWLARNEAWVGDPCYGFDGDFYVESDYRFHDADRGLEGFQPTYRPGQPEIHWTNVDEIVRPRVQIDPLFLDYEVDLGPDPLDEIGFFDGYLCATEWGIGLFIAALWAPFLGSRRRRLERWAYLGPAALGYGAGAYLGDFETTTPSALGLLSVSTGLTVYDSIRCVPPARNFSMGGTLATGGLALGLSGAHDCGYWGSWGDYGHFPQFEFRQPASEPPAGGTDVEYEWKLEYRYDWIDDFDTPPSGAGDDEDDDLGLGVGLKYDFGRGLSPDLQYEREEPPATDPAPPRQPGVKVPIRSPNIQIDPNLRGLNNPQQQRANPGTQIQPPNYPMNQPRPGSKSP